MAQVHPVDLVVVDTCIWVPYFNRPQSVERRAVDKLLDEDRAAITGMVLGEVLQVSSVMTKRTGLPRRFEVCTIWTLPGMTGDPRRSLDESSLLLPIGCR